MIETETGVLGELTIKEFVTDDLEELVLPASWLLDPGNDDVEAPHDPRFQVAKKLNDFISRAGRVYALLAKGLSTHKLIQRVVVLGHIPSIVHESIPNAADVLPSYHRLGLPATRRKPQLTSMLPNHLLIGLF